jgi:hypothetical protein
MYLILCLFENICRVNCEYICAIMCLVFNILKFEIMVAKRFSRDLYTRAKLKSLAILDESHDSSNRSQFA